MLSFAILVSLWEFPSPVFLFDAFLGSLVLSDSDFSLVSASASSRPRCPLLTSSSPNYWWRYLLLLLLSSEQAVLANKSSSTSVASDYPDCSSRFRFTCFHSREALGFSLDPSPRLFPSVVYDNRGSARSGTSLPESIIVRLMLGLI